MKRICPKNHICIDECLHKKEHKENDICDRAIGTSSDMEGCPKCISVFINEEEMTL